MRWALLGHEHAITFLHIDCEGLGTDLLVADGGKVWGFLRERLGNPLSSINFFLKDTFRLDEVMDLSDYDFEAVALRPRDRLYVHLLYPMKICSSISRKSFMMPCQPHFVFGYAHTICLGGHYYLSNQMQQTLRGLIHSFILHKFLTNTSHPTRILLRRMILFYHMGLLEDEIPESGVFSRSYQCPPYSCWIPVIPAESGGIRWSEIWQEGLLIFSFRCILSPAEFGHSRIETGMVPGLTGTECNWNPVVCVFIVCLFDHCFHTRYQTW